ncbi:hypothetical protein OH76DRAFT_1487991 [Lentinus brumalis]|uniref:Uncharacterized protein n=1 Tax=Lentinus brumalis TaxID=2498619 RepID=A0A371CSN3_9APHY|nr:hypothetical protein OH76DRAFT_1487991 [Polyporus brumalis]
MVPFTPFILAARLLQIAVLFFGNPCVSTKPHDFSFSSYTVAILELLIPVSLLAAHTASQGMQSELPSAPRFMRIPSASHVRSPPTPTTQSATSSATWIPNRAPFRYSLISAPSFVSNPALVIYHLSPCKPSANAHTWPWVPPLSSSPSDAVPRLRPGV